MIGELDILRQEIDKIDGEITALLRKRMELSGRVAEVKRESALPVGVPERERELMQRVSSAAGDHAEYIRNVYNTVLSQSREYQRRRLRCGLVGEKLPYTFSPQIHARLGGYPYKLFELAPEELEGFIRRGEYLGLNVTIPYKKAVMPFCDELTGEARHVGCVNTLLRRPDGSLLGHNTDYIGFLWLLTECGMDVRGKKVIVLGTGGASLTVQAALRDRGAGEIVVISRSGKDNYETVYAHADAALLVNATPVGTYPNNGECLVELSRLTGLECVLDLVYNPARTALLLQAERLGLRCANGLGMLVAQAAAASELFTGRRTEREKIYEIKTELERREKNILLIGMPGCGKTAVGRAAAQLLGREFYDSDGLIESRAGKSIPAIFDAEGEGAFRELEHAVLAELTKKSGAVIATGGGAVTREDNIALLRQNSTVVWLQRDTAALPTDGRPVSQTTPINELFARRAPLYEKAADMIVKNDCQTPEDCAKRLKEELFQ